MRPASPIFLAVALIAVVSTTAVSLRATHGTALIVAAGWLAVWAVARLRRERLQQRLSSAERERTQFALDRSMKAMADVKYALDQAAIVATTNVRGDITYVNDTFCAISKYSREELLGQNHRILNSGFHPAEYFKTMYATIGRGQVWRGEIRNRAKDGSIYWVDTTVVPFLDERGHPYQYTAIRYDITERKRSEAALRDQNALAQLGKMAAVVAHEVRNPLAGIKGALQVIGKRMPEDGQERAILTEVVARLDNLNDIVQDLLLFARPIQPALTRVALGLVIGDTVTLFRQDPAMRAVTVVVDDSPVDVLADAEQLKLVLLNLLMNGAQAMHGEGLLRITVETSGALIAIHIIDDGPGVPPDVREHLFEPFFTTRHRGTGLGLVTSRRVMEAHGGTVTLECPAAGGTVATVTLPAR